MAEPLDLAGPAALVALNGLVSLDPQFVLDVPAEQASVDLPLQSLNLLRVAVFSRGGLIKFEEQNAVRVIF